MQLGFFSNMNEHSLSSGESLNLVWEQTRKATTKYDRRQFTPKSYRVQRLNKLNQSGKEIEENNASVKDE